MDFSRTFEEHRGVLFGIAYRMLGSVSDAEDILQDAYLRWQSAKESHVDSPRAFLATTVTRLCLDHLKSARVRREQYVGPWLPEPLVMGSPPDATEKTEMAESLSMALLILLESLTPTERAVFLLREVFEYGYDEIARIVEKSEPNCRQLHRRAKQQIVQRRPRFEASGTKHQEIAQAFFMAVGSGDLEALENLLAEDAVSYGDGGGKANAARVPIRGREKVAKAFLGFARLVPKDMEMRAGWVNGSPALLLFVGGAPFSVNVFEISGGKITAIHSILNPDKLRHLVPTSGKASD